MMIEVLLFAQARQLVGANSTNLVLDSNSDVASLKDALARKHPELTSLLSRSNIAINQQYAAETDSIPNGAEVAMIPPVSGG